jgi:hypothetical protein
VNKQATATEHKPTWQDVDAYLQSKIPPKHRGKRVRRHKLLYAVWRAGILRTGEAPFAATFLRLPMGPYCSELDGANYEPGGNPDNISSRSRHDCDQVLALLAGSMAPELTVRSHSYAEYATGKRGTQITVEEVKRWGRAFDPQIRVPKDGKACKHSRHCRGCLKQVVRYLEFLCEKDSECFCFPSAKDILKHAQKPDETLYKKTIVYDCLKYLELNRLFVRAAKKRNGSEVKGWTMTPHSELASSDASWCVWGRPGDPNVRSTGVERALNEENAIPAETPAEENAVPAETPAEGINAPAESPAEKFPSFSGNSSSVSDGINSRLQAETLKTHIPSQVESGFTQEETDFKQVESQRAKPKPEDKTNGSLRSFQTSDHDQNPAGKFIEADSGTTVGDALRVIRNLDDLALIEQLSDSEFDTQFLTTYDRTRELADSCRVAINELSAEVFRGRSTLADIMGMAMERLRENCGQDAPRGWLPVMRKLRQKTEYGPRMEERIVEDNRRGPLADRKPTCFFYDVKPEEVWTGSYIECVWSACGKPNVPPEWKARVVELVREMGSPSAWGFVPFFEEAQSRFGTLPDGLQRMLDYEEAPA